MPDSAGVPVRDAAARLTKPGESDNAKRAAKSPPDGSSSASTRGPLLGHCAVSASANVVAPGEPFTEPTAINTARSPAPDHDDVDLARRKGGHLFGVGLGE